MNVNDYLKNIIINDGKAFKEGDVISTELWNQIINSFVDKINGFNDVLKVFDKNITDSVDAVNESAERVDWLYETVNKHLEEWSEWSENYRPKFEDLDNLAAELDSVKAMYASIKKSFVHYGEEAPTNPDVLLWVAPTEEPYDDSSGAGGGNGVGKATDGGGEIFNDYKNNAAMGKFTRVAGEQNVAMADHADVSGLANEGFGLRSFVRNYGNTAAGADSTAGGHGNIAGGWAADAGGLRTKALGPQAFTRGHKTLVEETSFYGVADGWETRVIETTGKAQGIRTLAQGKYGAFAHGGYGGAYDWQTESGGYGCLAAGDCSLATGHESMTKAAECNAQGVSTIAGLSGWGVTRIIKLSDTQVKVFPHAAKPADDNALAEAIKPGTYTLDGTDASRKFYTLEDADGAGKAFGKNSVADPWFYCAGYGCGVFKERVVLYVNNEVYVPDAVQVNLDNELALTLTFNNGIPFYEAFSTYKSDVGTVYYTDVAHYTTDVDHKYNHKHNLLSDATVVTSAVKDGSTVATLEHAARLELLTDGTTLSRNQLQLPNAWNSAYNFGNANKNTYIQLTFALKDTTSNIHSFLIAHDDYRSEAAPNTCQWYELFASDKEEDLYTKPVFEYKNTNKKMVEQRVVFPTKGQESYCPVGLTNVKYFGIRFYYLVNGCLALPSELALYNQFSASDAWLGNFDNCGYPLEACHGANTRGYETQAYAKGANANGIGTIALYKAQTSIGMYNNPRPDALLSVGNGTSDENRHNAFEVLIDGSIRVNEEVTITPAKLQALLALLS